MQLSFRTLDGHPVDVEPDGNKRLVARLPRPACWLRVERHAGEPSVLAIMDTGLCSEEIKIDPCCTWVEIAFTPRRQSGMVSITDALNGPTLIEALYRLQ